MDIGISKPKVKKPKIVKKAQKEAEKVVKHGKDAIKGQVVINVRNYSNGKIIVTASIGNERRVIEAGGSGDIKKPNIGDAVEIYVSGEENKKTWRQTLIQNRYNLEYNGRSLKKA